MFKDLNEILVLNIDTHFFLTLKVVKVATEIVSDNALSRAGKSIDKMPREADAA